MVLNDQNTVSQAVGGQRDTSMDNGGDTENVHHNPQESVSMWQVKKERARNQNTSRTSNNKSPEFQNPKYQKIEILKNKISELQNQDLHFNYKKSSIPSVNLMQLNGRKEGRNNAYMAQTQSYFSPLSQQIAKVNYIKMSRVNKKLINQQFQTSKRSMHSTKRVGAKEPVASVWDVRSLTYDRKSHPMNRSNNQSTVVSKKDIKMSESNFLPELKKIEPHMVENELYNK